MLKSFTPHDELEKFVAVMIMIRPELEEEENAELLVPFIELYMNTFFSNTHEATRATLQEALGYIATDPSYLMMIKDTDGKEHYFSVESEAIPMHLISSGTVYIMKEV